MSSRGILVVVIPEERHKSSYREKVKVVSPKRTKRSKMAKRSLCKKNLHIFYPVRDIITIAECLRSYHY